MVLASDLRQGMALRIEGQIYKVIDVESKAGAAKMGGVVKTKLINAASGRMWEPHFRPQEKVEDLELTRRTMEFLYSESDTCTFMRPDTFEQIDISNSIVAAAYPYLRSGMELPMEFFGDQPISIIFPEVVDARVADTAAPSHSQQDNAWKEATLENGHSIRVPLFIASGELIRVEVSSGRYIERARAERRRTA